jgi:hypothetical protein
LCYPIISQVNQFRSESRIGYYPSFLFDLSHLADNKKISHCPNNFRSAKIVARYNDSPSKIS